MKIKKLMIGCMVIGVVIMLPGYHDVSNMVFEKSKTVTIVIDPGHGGPDSGTVGNDGTKEKDLNLEISKAIAKEAAKSGMKVVMTRTTEDGLYGELGVWRKAEDIKMRKKIIDESGADLALTVHMNSYKEDKDVRGAQVFFPKINDEQMGMENEQLAVKIQEYLTKGLSDGSDRKAMYKNNIFLFKDVRVKTILIECGFLSNDYDLNMLKTPKFQQKIAVYIIKAISEKYSLNIQT